MTCRHKLCHFTVANLVLPRRVSGAVKRVFATVKWYNICLQIIEIQIVLLPFQFILIKRIFKTFSLCCYVALLRTWRRPCFHGINALILIPSIFDVTVNENACYKRNELEWKIKVRNSKIKVGNSNNKVGFLKIQVGYSNNKVGNSKIQVQNWKHKVWNSKNNL